MAVSLNTDPEFEALATSVATIIENIKAKKSSFTDYEPLMMPLFKSIGSFSNVINDAKKVDNQVLLLKVILDAVEAPKLMQMVRAKLAARKVKRQGPVAEVPKLEQPQHINADVELTVK